MPHALLPNAVDILESLVGFDTTSRDSNLPLIEWVEQYLHRNDVPFQRIASHDGKKANLWATIGEGDGGIVLSGHTDVVPIDGQDWHTPPFTLSIKNDRLYGRGTSDMKSFIACVLALVPAWKKAPPTLPIHIALSYDEEVGCIGVPHLLSFVAKQGVKPSIAIIGEPTEMKIVVGHKGIASYETTFQGIEGHSSDPERGINAIEHAARFIAFLETLQTSVKVKQDSSFHPPHTTIHVGVIRGGTARNIIPRSCYVNWEIRPIIEQDLLDIESKVAHYQQALDSELKKKHPEAGVSQKVISRNPVLVSQPEFPHQAKIMTVLSTNQTQTIAFYTEGGLFQKSSIPSVVIGPGSIKQAHAPNEYIEISQIDQCLSFIEKISY
jgi:acetylornithine deacetylase